MSPHHSAFVRRAGLVAVGQMAVKSTQVVLAVVLVRLLSPTEWNEAAFLLSVYLAVVTIGTFNMQQGILFFLPRVGSHHQRALVVQNIGLLVAVGAAIGAVLALGAPALSGGRLGDASRLPLVGLAVALELPTACTATALVATRRFRAAAVWDLTGTLIVVGATVVPVALGTGVAGLAGGLAVAGGVRLVGSGIVIARCLPGSVLGLPWSFLWRQIVHAVPLGAALGVSILNRTVDKWFVAVFRSGDFGVYAVAAQEVPLLAVLPYAGGTALVAALVDAFHEGDLGAARAHWLHLTMTMSMIVVPMSVLVVLVAPEVMTAVFTADFAAGVLPFQIFTVITIHRVAEYGMLLRAAGRNRDLLVVALVTCGSNVLCAGVGAATGGMIGASIGTLLASMLGWAMALRRIASVLGVGVRDAFAWTAWSVCVAVAVMASGGATVVLAMVEAVADVGAGTRIVVKLSCFVGGYVGGLLAWRRSPQSRPPDAIVVPRCGTRSQPRPDAGDGRSRAVVPTHASRPVRPLATPGAPDTAASFPEPAIPA